MHMRGRRRQRAICAAVALSSVLPGAFAANCISLSGSTQCGAFNASSVSLDASVVGLFPFLSQVTDTASFDTQLQSYISGAWAQTQYQQLIGCSNFDAQNTTNYYARYTTSVLCNAIIQNSAPASQCNLQGTAAAPLCADACADYVQDEERIASSSACGTQGNNADSQFRADFTNCALPAQSLRQGSCIPAVSNQPNDCGFANNLGGLCNYCASSSPNATDSCCVFSNTPSRCQGVNLAIGAATSTPSASASSRTTSATSSPTAAGQSGNGRSGLTGAQIAGIVVGVLLGTSILAGILITVCLLTRHRRSRSPASSLNRPNPPRYGAAAVGAAHDGADSRDPEKIVTPPGGRVTRMSAIDRKKEYAPGAVLADGYQSSDSEGPGNRGVLGAVPPKRRNFDASGRPMNAAGLTDESSPEDTFSSPEEGTGTGTGQSEQLAVFKDYYSQDEIHVGDLVSTLWAYQPRAQDEFELDRGDMLKVTGIWDDGWATGIRIRTKADRWREPGHAHRDSGVSDSSYGGDGSPETDADVKAFPLVCVCLPRYWRDTVEGESDDRRSSDG